MPKQSISLTKPNDGWLNMQVASEEYTSKSEVVNDMIRRHEYNKVKSKLLASEQSGLITLTREEILAEFKDELRRDGKL